MGADSLMGAMPPSYWAGDGGRSWSDVHDLMERLYRPIGETVEAAIDLRPGQRVLDVGCGAGHTTLSAGRGVGPGGLCVGVDVSATLLELGRRQAAAEALPQVEFVEADAQAHDFGVSAFDAVISRFGVMFFCDPVAAFENLRRSVRADGRLAFASWRSPAENPLAQAPLEAATPFLGEIPRPAKNAPGRFAFADSDRVRRILQDSGWRDIKIEPLDVPTPVTLDELVILSTRLGPLAPVLAKQSATLRAEVEAAVVARLETCVVNGIAPMTAACWLVTARKAADTQ